MNDTLARFELVEEREVVGLRSHARAIADRLGFPLRGQVEIASAVSTVARDALRSGVDGCRVEFRLEGDAPPSLAIRVVARVAGPPGSNPFHEAVERRIGGLSLQIEGDPSDPMVQTLVMVEALPSGMPSVSPPEMARCANEPDCLCTVTALDELIRQDRELLQVLDDFETQARERSGLDRKLEEAARAIVALDVELDERAESLKRAVETKRRFLSNVSHELRTPVASILSLTRLLLDRADGDLSVEQERQISFIDRASGDLLSLINDLLDLARFDAGREVLRLSEVHPSELFTVLRGIFRPFQPPRSAVTVVFEEPDRLPSIWTDPAKLTQILHKIVSSALKSTELGEVRLRAEAGADDSVVFSVTDPGVGIEPDQLERVFEEFGQVESPLGKVAKGTGLGLPLASKLARLLGGRVDVRSESGVGSTFTLTIPVRFPGETAG
jgi:signal transduction histidine kinase